MNTKMTVACFPQGGARPHLSDIPADAGGAFQAIQRLLGGPARMVPWPRVHDLVVLTPVRGTAGPTNPASIAAGVRTSGSFIIARMRERNFVSLSEQDVHLVEFLMGCELLYSLEASRLARAVGP